ncbi:MAG: hypothetical protein RJB38_1738 [Pseudomonadota bacterium]|jgi:endonuclease/exonuclease/phosphatase family metal-dependent hydrolase
MILRVLTYNIHKGFHHLRRKKVLHLMRHAIRESKADLVFLQEVLGFDHQEDASQLEYLADEIWHHHAYGRNAVTTLGHHGNAVLSKYPITFFENIDISTNSLEKRGILHAVVRIPELDLPIHALSIHLGLFESDRRSQIRRICHRIHRTIKNPEPLIMGGDFNDWRERASPILEKRLNVKEAYHQVHGAHARSFPIWMPSLRLDRLYFRGLRAQFAQALVGAPWSRLSDHAALYAELELEATPTETDVATRSIASSN